MAQATSHAPATARPPRVCTLVPFIILLFIILCILIIHVYTLWPATLQYYMYSWLTLKGSKAVKERELPEGSRVNGRDTAFTSEADSNSVLK